MTKKQNLDGGAVYVISVAAELAGMHPQTLRQYDRMGLVTPQRTKGRGRRYSAENVQQLRKVQRLSQEEGINLAGISRIMELERENAKLRAENQNLKAALAKIQERQSRVFTVSPFGDVVETQLGRRTDTRRRTAAKKIAGREIVRYRWI